MIGKDCAWALFSMATTHFPSLSIVRMATAAEPVQWLDDEPEGPFTEIPREMRAEIMAHSNDVLDLAQVPVVNKEMARVINGTYIQLLRRDFSSPLTRERYTFVHRLEQYGRGRYSGPQYYSVATLALAIVGAVAPMSFGNMGQQMLIATGELIEYGVTGPEPTEAIKPYEKRLGATSVRRNVQENLISRRTPTRLPIRLFTSRPTAPVDVAIGRYRYKMDWTGIVVTEARDMDRPIRVIPAVRMGALVPGKSITGMYHASLADTTATSIRLDDEETGSPVMELAVNVDIKTEEVTLEGTKGAYHVDVAITAIDLDGLLATHPILVELRKMYIDMDRAFPMPRVHQAMGPQPTGNVMIPVSILKVIAGLLDETVPMEEIDIFPETVLHWIRTTGPVEGRLTFYKMVTMED